jgi:pimeloyl-ACP methyl ester carboxylesterase
MDIASEFVELPDGRRLEMCITGPGGGVPLVFHHGTPGGGRIYEPFAREAAARGLRMVTYSRPGYGSSTRNPGRDVAACAADTAAILDHLGADRAYTAGASGGGPHTLACAALLPERIVACATIAGVGQFGVEDLDFLNGMAQENHDEFGAALAGEDELRGFLEDAAEIFSTVSADDVAESLGGLVSDVDKAAITGEFADFLVDSFHHAMENGIWGWFDDDMAFTRPWGFELSSIEVPVTVWQGAQDRMVPFSHGQWLVAHIPGARAELRPEHGHLSLAVANVGAIMDQLMTEAA